MQTMVVATTDIDTDAHGLPVRKALSMRAGEIPAGPVEILPLEEALRSVGADWHDLEQRSGNATFFQGTAWAATVLEWRRSAPDAGNLRDCMVLLARGRDGRLKGLWPFQTERHMGATLAVPLGDPFNQYSDILIAPDADRASVTASLMAALEALGSISGVLLRKTRADAACMAYMAAHGRVLASMAAPMVDLTPFEDFQDYHRTVKTKTRKNLRNARNRLERSGGKLEHIVHEGHEAVSDAVERAFELRTEWLDREGTSSRAFLDAGFARFVRQLSERQSPGSPDDDGEIELVAFELRQGEEMLSIQWGFVDKRRYYAFIAVRNPAFDAQSPGRLHLEDVIRSCAERGIEVVDFLAPDVEYKQTWATDTVPVRDYGIAFGLRGSLVLMLALGRPRQIAKQVFDRLPRGVRHACIRLMARVAG